MIVQFERGCRRCEHLVHVAKDTWMCESRLHMDDSTVFPIVEGKKNEEDWDACKGEDYKIVVDKSARRRKSS